jgi:hypothetical protein
MLLKREKPLLSFSTPASTSLPHRRINVKLKGRRDLTQEEVLVRKLRCQNTGKWGNENAGKR